MKLSVNDKISLSLIFNFSQATSGYKQNTYQETGLCNKVMITLSEFSFLTRYLDLLRLAEHHQG